MCEAANTSNGLSIAKKIADTMSDGREAIENQESTVAGRAKLDASHDCFGITSNASQPIAALNSLRFSLILLAVIHLLLVVLN
jgi:hypothetical protein